MMFEYTREDISADLPAEMTASEICKRLLLAKKTPQTTTWWLVSIFFFLIKRKGS